MRILSVLLSIHLLFLIAAPSLDMAGFVFRTTSDNGSCSDSFNEEQIPDEASSCCEASEDTQCGEPCSQPSQEEQSPEENGKCCDMACNTCVCCCCCALSSQETSFSAPFTYSSQKYHQLSETAYSHFLSDAWKPPRIV